mmetsp:Transcript_6031/g.9115  ORF Transcript_6031/g.9115 Transcript_6031/m.9115 type:complete len:468 (+) Transcript_6031:78-1481(+)
MILYNVYVLVLFASSTWITTCALSETVKAFKERQRQHLLKQQQQQQIQQEELHSESSINFDRQRQALERQWVAREQSAHAPSDTVEDTEEYYYYYAYDEDDSSDQASPYFADIDAFSERYLISMAKKHANCLRKGEEDPLLAQAIQLVEAKRLLTEQINNAMQGLGRNSFGNSTNFTLGENKTESSEEVSKTKSGAKSKKAEEEKTEEEIEEEKRLAKERELEEVLDKGSIVGADCETQLCGACKLVVQEFAQAVEKQVGNAYVKYMNGLTEEFCESRAITTPYLPLVQAICKTLFSGDVVYRNAIIQTVLAHHQASASNLSLLQQQVCLPTGYCVVNQMRYDLPKTLPTGDILVDRCEVCRALGRHIEEMVSLVWRVTDSAATGIVREACDKMALSSELHDHCSTISSGRKLAEIAWISKVYSEDVERKKRSKVSFPVKLCNEIKFCFGEVDEKATLMRTIDAVYS